jgi:hypothetical protein
MVSLCSILALAALLPSVRPSLLFSPPTLVAFSSANASAARSPAVPDKFYALAAAAAGSPLLLFGVQDAASFAVSADAGATWATVATPHDLTPQGDLLVPLYDGAADPAAAAPSAYHSIGSSVTISPGGWVQQGITTVRASAPGSGGAALAQAFNATAGSTFTGVPAPGLNASCSPSTSPPCDLPRLFGAMRLADGSYLLAATAALAGTPAHPTPDGTRAPVSLLAFASLDSFTWRCVGVIANASAFPWSDFGPTESDLAYAADGATLTAVIRMSGDADCENGNYRDYFAASSADSGSTWSLPTEVPGLGCVRPRLLRMPGGPLLLSGGRNCVAGRKDISLWESAAAAAAAGGALGAGWVEHSLTFQHNRLWQGSASFLFDARVNATTGFETLSYTSLVRTGPGSFAIFYNKFFSPGWPPWPSANFMMQVSVV